MKIIKISDTHNIGVENSTIKDGDWIYNPVLSPSFVQVTEKTFPTPNGLERIFLLKALNDNKETYKVTHSTIPIEEDNRFFLIKPLSASDVDEFISGYGASLDEFVS